MSRSDPHNILLLQGGGALGAYQAGAFQTLSATGPDPDWVAGISIGAINAAIIGGNKPDDRLTKLRGFWEEISSGFASNTFLEAALTRGTYSGLAASAAMWGGVPGFYKPRSPWEFWMNGGDIPSVYDTSDLRGTLLTFVDFDYLNEEGPRISVGAVEVETGNFRYFDSINDTICPEHIMASGALPPGFPAVEIDGHAYWDGGLVSNTPLQYVLQSAPDQELTIFQVDLFSARGDRPRNLSEAMQREKDIRYSSRTRLTTDRYRQLHDMRCAAERLAAKLPEEFKDDKDLALLRAAAPSGPITLVHLIHRPEDFETHEKDYEFSHITMTDHWAQGARDMHTTLTHPKWTKRKPLKEGLKVFDLAGEKP